MNDKQERMSYIRSLRDSLMAQHNKEQDYEKSYAIIKLAIRNQTLLGCNTPSFMFMGSWYSAGVLPRPKEMLGWNRTIHHTLKEKVYKLLNNNSFSTRYENAVMSGLFSNLLSAAGCNADLYRLLPRNYFNSLGLVNPKFDIAPPMLDEEIAAIIEANQEGFQYLNQVKVRNLLLKKQGNI